MNQAYNQPSLSTWFGHCHINVRNVYIYTLPNEKVLEYNCSASAETCKRVVVNVNLARAQVYTRNYILQNSADRVQITVRSSNFYLFIYLLCSLRVCICGSILIQAMSL